jgi:DNA (cytosine-5)-methyltransferase 1
MLDFVNKSMKTVDKPLFRVISTFSGGGGSSLGYRWAGGKVLAAIEWDENAVATYRLNFPDTPVLHRDITTVTTEELLTLTGLQVGELDILDGSPPCQGLSTAGKRQFDDPRNSLFKEFVRLLRGLQPKVFVMENVSGMVKGHMKHIFALIMRELKAAGYQVKCQLMNAMYFGVPQSRERVIFIGVRNDLGIEVSHPAAHSKPTPFVPHEDIGNALVISDIKWKQIQEHKLRHKLKGNSFGYHLHISSISMRTITKEALLNNHNLIPYGKTARQLNTAELLEVGSYPNTFMLAGKYEDAFNRIGNSVPPMFMFHIASHIYTHILSKTHATATLIERIGEVAHA